MSALRRHQSAFHVNTGHNYYEVLLLEYGMPIEYEENYGNNTKKEVSRMGIISYFNNNKLIVVSDGVWICILYRGFGMIGLPIYTPLI